jgi:glutamine cyclotransferase
VRSDQRLGIAFALAVCAAVVGCGDDSGSSVSSLTSTTEPVTSTPLEPGESTTTTAPRKALVEVIHKFGHDPTAYTQGLEMIDADTVIESTGLDGASTIRVVDIETGEVQRSQPLEDDLFGEGVTLTERGTAIQLTWRSGRALIYDSASLRQIGEHTYDGEGWGLCLDNDRLVMSDGSDTLTLRDPTDFSVLGTLEVTRNEQPVDLINELECVDGDVYANRYTTDEIVRIDLDTGKVITTVDAAGLLTADESAAADVLNGIAYDASDGTFLITGKNWPWMFRVRFV